MVGTLWRRTVDKLGDRVIIVTKPLLTTTDDRHLFIVRLWREDSQLAPGGQWRGSVEHVPSGQRIHFVSLETLMGFISQYLSTDNHEQEAA
jgi:hypothetical protein